MIRSDSRKNSDSVQLIEEASYDTPPPATKRMKMAMSRSQRSTRPPALPRLLRTVPARIDRMSIYNPQAVIASFKSETPPRLSSLYSPREGATDSYLDQCFRISRLLGNGSFGKVVAARSLEDNRCYAIKYTMEPYYSKSDRRIKLDEVRKHEALPVHPNLVRFICAWEERGRLYIQTELCEKSLADVCHAEHELSEERIWSYFIDVLLAVRCLHARDLLHVDIKPENIFITVDDVCKLGDFGLMFDEKCDLVDSAREGDCKYLAAEVLNDERPSKASDIFSLGITLLEIATDMDLPQNGTWWHQLRSGYLPMQLVKGLSPALLNAITSMMDPNPTKRPSAVQLLASRDVRTRMSRRQLAILR